MYISHHVALVPYTRLETDRRYIIATDAKQQVAEALDAVQRAPIVIGRHARDQAVLISPQEYDRLPGLAAHDLQSFCDRVGAKAAALRWTASKLAALLHSDD